MTTSASESGTTTLTFDKMEKDELLQLLDTALGDVRVEVHRTHTPSYRDRVLQREKLLKGLIAKFGHESS